MRWGARLNGRRDLESATGEQQLAMPRSQAFGAELPGETDSGTLRRAAHI